MNAMFQKYVFFVFMVKYDSVVACTRIIFASVVEQLYIWHMDCGSFFV